MIKSNKKYIYIGQKIILKIQQKKVGLATILRFSVKNKQKKSTRKERRRKTKVWPKKQIKQQRPTKLAPNQKNNFI